MTPSSSTSWLKEIPRRFPDIDVALLHLGGTMFFGLLMVTMDPEQGVEVIRLVMSFASLAESTLDSLIEDFMRDFAELSER